MKIVSFDRAVRSLLRAVEEDNVSDDGEVSITLPPKSFDDIIEQLEPSVGFLSEERNGFTYCGVKILRGKPPARHPKSYELDGPIGDDGIRRIRRVPRP